MRRFDLRRTAPAQRFSREFDVGADVELAGLVLRVELVVAAPEFGFVDPAEPDHELAPGMVGVERQQRVVEVEQTQVHAPSSSVIICLSSGTVIARLCASAKWSSRPSRPIRNLRSRL